jgi:hypothetical protein
LQERVRGIREFVFGQTEHPEAGPPPSSAGANRCA